MLKRITTYAGMALVISACESPPPAFTPAPESYGQTVVMIEGVAEARTIASVDSTFFGEHTPLLGRHFVSREYEGGNAVAILSHGFWGERFGEDPGVVGSRLDVGGVVRTVIAVMPEGIDVPEGVALWIPMGGS